MSDVKIIVTADSSPAQQNLEKLPPALANATTATKKAGEATADYTLKQKDKKEAIQSAARAIPGLEAALILLKNPYVALISVIAGAVGALKGFIATEQEAARKSAELATSLGPLFEQMRQATTIAEAAAAAQVYADSIDAARIASQTSTTDLEKANTAAKTENDHLAKKTELLRDLARLDIKIDQSTGKITGEQAASRLAALGGQFAKEDSAAAIAAQVAESQRLQKAAEDAAARSGQIGTALPGAQTDAAAAARRFEELKAQTAQSEPVRKARQEEIAKQLADQELVIATAQQNMSGSPIDKARQILGPGAGLADAQKAALVSEQQQLQRAADAQAAALVRAEADKNSKEAAVKALQTAQQKADADAAKFAGQEASVATGINAAQQSAAELNPLRDANVRVEQNLQTIEENKRRAAEEDALRRALDAEALRRGPPVGGFNGAAIDALIDPTRDLAQSVRTIVGYIQEANQAVALLDSQLRNSRGQV